MDSRLEGPYISFYCRGFEKLAVKLNILDVLVVLGVGLKFKGCEGNGYD